MFSKSSSKLDSKRDDSIVVKLHGFIVDEKDNKMVPREPYICQQESICAEDLECQVAQHLGISNFALPLFGLQQQHCDWLLPSTTIRRGEVLSFSLRLAFADQARLYTVTKLCAATLDYIYGQLREGFLSKQWNLSDMDKSEFANIIIYDMRCQSYSLGWRASELKKKLNFDSFCGTNFNGLKNILDKTTLKDHCVGECGKGYRLQDSCTMTQGEIDKLIKYNKYSYISHLLKQITWGSTYECLDGQTLTVLSNSNQGLQIGVKNLETSRMIEVGEMLDLNVAGREFELMSLNRAGALKREKFSLKREEDAKSLGLLLNVLYKLSVNYMTDLWPLAQRRIDQLCQEIHSYPPTKGHSWPTDRLLAVNEIEPKYQYIVFEDFNVIGDFYVIFLGQSHAVKSTLHFKRQGQEDVWFNKEDPKTLFHLKDLDTIVAEHIGNGGLTRRVPLLLPFTYNELIYHCRKKEENFHTPTVFNKYTFSSWIREDKTTTSVYKANVRMTQKSKAGDPRDVAIMRLENPDLYMGFTNVIRQMTHWQHDNLIRLHGVSFAHGLETIVDYFDLGDLRCFLNNLLGNEVVKILHLVKITEQLLRALIYLSPEELQEMLNVAADWGRKWRMKFSAKESNVVYFKGKRTPATNLQFRIDGTCLERVDKYKYLGVFLNEHLDYTVMSENLADHVDCF